MCRRWTGLLAALVLAGCSRTTDSPSAATTSSMHRVELRKTSGDTIQVIPTPGQLPYCLVFTHSEKGVTRQLTISKNNVSVQCPAGQPVLGQTYRIPLEEGAVRVHVFFSDQRLGAASVANQLNEMSQPSFHPIDFRLPGRVLVDTTDYIPSASGEPRTGAVVEPPTAQSDRPGG